MNKHINKIRNSSCDQDNISKAHHANIIKAPLQTNKTPKHNNIINNAHKEHKKKKQFIKWLYKYSHVTKHLNKLQK